MSSDNQSPVSFETFLGTAFDQGNYATDDVIAFVMPLFEEVLSFHENGLVAPFGIDRALFITGQHLDIDERLAHAPLSKPGALEPLFEALRAQQFDVIGKSRLETDVETGAYRVESLQIHLDNAAPLQSPAYLKGYRCFEQLLGHHDEQTDIFCLGLILGSMALSLDLYDEEDLRLFAEYRNNPVQYNQRIHPTISALITEMTELDRHKRCSSLYEVIHRLHHYRDYDPDRLTDLSTVPGWINKALTERSQLILNKLRNRLFDTSRRNRLLYYKGNMRFVNLTVSSVPIVLHYQSIRPDLLFTWNDDISSKVKGMKELVLNKYLRFEDHAYLPAALDKIRVESQRDVQEYGFSQLKLVITFLNWHNLKEDAQERIQSPLLLVPVEIRKTRRLKEDHYTLKVLDNAAEVNPVLANQLRELYGIRLPDFVDLDTMDLTQFYQQLKAQIDAANQGIQLRYIDKPRIKLVHSVAKLTVGNYRRRLRRSGSQLDSYKNISYSYQAENFRPLGLEIFRQRIEHRASFLEFLINDDIKISSNQLTGDDTRERALFEMAESENNPYSWDYDLCNIVLGNFNYKKMSLVRDYNHVIDNNVQHDVFNALFSTEPRQPSSAVADLNDPGSWHHVIAADPTQTQAILHSRTGQSFIIQGPPGTGKSQTITNLIADFVARGKNILFVCEKRAALDVVFHRLKQNGLDELCCYIHDSQGDKRDFIRELRTTYESFTTHRMDLAALKQRHAQLLAGLQTQLQLLQLFHDTHSNTPETAGISIHQLIERVIELKQQLIPLSAVQLEALPHYSSWTQFGDTIEQLSAALEEQGAEAAFAQHPLSQLNDGLLKTDNPISQAYDHLQAALQLMTQLQSLINSNSIAPQHSTDLQQIKNLVQDAQLLQPLAENDLLGVVKKDNNAAREFDRHMQHYQQLREQAVAAAARNTNWLQRFSEQDLSTALPVAEKQEKSFFRFLNGAWKQLKKQVHASYDFSKHQVKPSVTSVLQLLKAAYDAQAAASQYRQELQRQYRLQNIETTYLGIEVLRNKQGDQEIDYLLAHPQANELVKRLSAFLPSFQQLENHLHQSLLGYQTKSLAQITDELDSLLVNMEALQELLPALREYSQLPEPIKQALRLIPLGPRQAEAAMAQRTLQELLRQHRSFASADMPAIEQAVKQIRQAYNRLLRLNADLIRATVRQQFLQNLELSNTALSQLNNEQKQFKKIYNEGRKILENEFGKSMRFKSIRELSARESGRVLKDLKPIWLMSPLSVSDSLPLDTEFFDVVIFDEASQITLEEGIPALYRSTQAIIVGDDKQMPPTNFFTARAEDPDDLDTTDTTDEEELLSTEADSLLVQGSRKLGSTMLSWHYRSRYETLISYSNHAFYEAGLLTIPDRTIHHESKKIIEISKPEEAVQYADTLYDRSISFHFHTDGLYEKRSNNAEATYIAHLVRELLKRKVKESIGIVAFSQEQQHTIEDALSALAQTDPEFEILLEDAYNRTEEDQFVGLIVKNLENIQGDERDIIIMSVCYGFDTRKRILMNFGPINKKGGEKRLNVIFSRARKHMAVVSSIHYHHITNEYNEGANYFRRFLHYAENVSAGNMDMARTILDSLVVNKQDTRRAATGNIVMRELRQQLQQQGFVVAEQVGQSGFKCSLSIKASPADQEYTLGILIDDNQHYENNNLVEQYYQRPAILQAFGWRCMHVFAKDWLQNPQRVVEQVIRKLKETPQEETLPAEEETAVPDPVKPALSSESPVASASALSATVSTAAVPAGYEHLTFTRLEFTEGTSSKFWEVATDGSKLYVRFGKIGTKGQIQVKNFESGDKAEREREKLIREKAEKGYRLI